MRLALENGADPNKKLVRHWTPKGQPEGQAKTHEFPESAFIWKKRLGEKAKYDDKTVMVNTPLESAIAGRNPECIEAPLKAGADSRKALSWVTGLEQNIVRVAAAISLAEALAGLPDEEKEKHRPGVTTWLSIAAKWLKKQPGANIAGEERWERVIAMHGQMSRVCTAWGLPYAMPVALDLQPPKTRTLNNRTNFVRQ